MMLNRVKQSYRQAGLLVGLPYKFGGGHNTRFLPSLNGETGIGATGAGYDCSSAASVALRAGGLLAIPRATLPLDTVEFLTWGEPGAGEWMTIYVINTTGEQHMAIRFSIEPDPTGFYSETWFQAANETVGIGWIPLSDQEIASAVQRHWPNT